MSINYRKRSLTDGNRALQLFTDRYDITRIFVGYLNDDPATNKILFFHGDGGNGKSLLLKFLAQKCCKRLRLESWRELQPKSDQEVAEYIEDLADVWEFTPIPAVLQDFGLKGTGDEQPQDPFYGLLMLRRKLSSAATKLKSRLQFPLYDFACVWYLKQKNRLTTEKLKELFPAEELDLLIEIVNAVSDTSWGTIVKAVLGIFNKHLGENFILQLQKRGIKAEDLQEICQMDVDTELINELPRYLAQDLNAAMTQQNAPERIVLFFDTHEAFWGYQRNLPDPLFFQKDEWLRYFLAELALESGIVAVVAGREIPRWEQAENFPIPQKYLDIRLVNHLSPDDADVYLERAEVTNEELRKSVIVYASVAANQVHPFLLGLCADVVLQAKEQKITLTPADFPKIPETVNKAEILINRLLKYADREIGYAVHALSACRAFNFEIYQFLGEELHFQTTKPAFDILTEFSFVWDVQQLGQDWYRIHDLLRRLDYEGGKEDTKKAHEVLEKYYRQQGNVAEAIYHANRLDWLRGVDEWVEVFEEALKTSLYEQCRSLLEIRSELVIESNFDLGRVSQCEADCFNQLSRYQEAKQEYLEAVAAYKQELSITPDDTATLYNLGVVLRSLGNLQTRLSEPQALQCYTDSIAACNALLSLTPNDNKVLRNVLSSKGLTLQQLGDLQTQRKNYNEAFQPYNDAIDAYNFILSLIPDDNDVFNNKGIALEGLGYLQTQLARDEKALQSYKNAIIAYNCSLNLATDHRYLNNKGVALQKLGDLQTKLAQNEEALQSYNDAIIACQEALTLAPSYINAFTNKGSALARLGNLQKKLTHHYEALQSYSDAVTAYNSALNIAPNDNYALNNKGNVLKSLGDLQTQLSQYQEALKSYEDAINIYKSVLKFAPDDNEVLDNLGLTLQSLGKLLLELAQKPEAVNCFQEALNLFNRSLVIAPDNEEIRNLRDELQAFIESLD
ncbi:tetratricopeptide repeat protein [Sphaerospermopsis aphanizomenoides BCCUSP55]|uniref:tetratricopeptide repeat protein n=1 Tax=Sphaerospermopsis aphanizomenoides TaxID=459663 RepID=UPI00190639A8|nr:tetratricopeptide repeat protein [Sphaerospermopsis aphanizomenoides]MBK1987511.1 tetratricopeptide repeat protein [Sphaerospermopsis aphanizomenoides BCCUSP55]